MAKFWLSFMEIVEILNAKHTFTTYTELGSIQGITQDDVTLASYLYDNDKYGRWLVEFWLEISSLPVEKDKYMMDGLFAQLMTGKAYSCLPLRSVDRDDYE
jgi:hypothetical protein